MARHASGPHASGPRRASRPAMTLGLFTTLVIAACGAALLLWHPGAPSPAESPVCQTAVRVVTAASFAPVLSALAPALAAGEDCARLEVTIADGRAAAARFTELGAHVWIPDDSSWAGVAGATKLAKPVVGGAGTVVATSPIYLVTDPTTAERISAAGSSWLGLAGLVTGGSGVRLVVCDPAGSGDGLVAAGAFGEAVWLTAGMNASAEALATALPATRTVPGTAPAMPVEDGEVGLVPEYVLLGQAAATPGYVVLAPADHTAVLRFTWLPAAGTADDPALARAMDRMLRTIVGPDGREPLAAAGLRGLERKPPAAAWAGTLPAVSATPFDVLAPHHVEHVFATWYAADRRSDLLVVVDVSGSMATPAPGTETPLIDLVRQGCDRVGELLPDDSELSLWEFGSRLDPPRDHRELLPGAPMTAGQRQALAGATQALTARQTGTGLYDTLLAAYLSARDSYRSGTPNHVVVFTDGRNEDDPDSISPAQLAEQLAAARNPQRPVLLTVVTFGPEPETEVLKQALRPVGGGVSPLTTAAEVRAVFIHIAAGGLHG